MALRPINHLIVGSTPLWGDLPGNATLNANNESFAAVGTVRFQDGASPKTISSAGGAILILLGACTFATATSTFRVGLMDVDGATGLEDGTFDVYKEFVQGTDTITGNSLMLAAMTTGSKTLADGDLLAIVTKMPVRAGVDTIAIASVNTCAHVVPTAFANFPYGTANTSGTLLRSSLNILMALLRADDGTVGWIEACPPPWINAITGISFHSGSTPDEYSGTFLAPCTMQINGIGLALFAILGTDPFELILYRDPYGAATVVQTVVVDPDIGSQVAGNAGTFMVPLTPVTLAAGTTYGIAVRPTSTNPISVGYINWAAAGALATTPMMALIKAACFLPQMKFAARTNQTGPFVEVAATAFPIFVLDICGLDDGVVPARTVAYASA
jgi:hypothetical protein